MRRVCQWFLVMLAVVGMLGSGVSGAETEWERDFGESSLFRTSGSGVPVVQGGSSLTEVFEAVGYAQTRDRLFQVWLRLVAASGRLSELLEPSSANVEADVAVRLASYSSDELLAQFAALDNATQAIYRGFVQGMQNALPLPGQPLPYEFHALNVTSLGPNVFSLPSVLTFAVFTMRRLAAGWDPTFQLDNLNLMSELQAKWGPTDAAQVFHDLVTTVESFPLETIVVNRSAPVLGGQAVSAPQWSGRSRSSSHIPAASRKLLPVHRRHLARTRSVEHHLRALGAVNQDGSWAAVSKSDNGNVYAEFGPQDDNNFPTTFYEVYVDSQIFSAHWFTEPGMPMNQLYGVAANFSFGRNRGYAYCNDYLTEPSSQAILVRTDRILFRNGSSMDLPIYRSKSGGFVMSRDDESGTVLTLRSAFVGTEMAGLNMVSKIVLCKTLDEVISTLLVESQQSCTIHSHLEVADSTTVGAILNGLITEFPPEAKVDRRFPLEWNATGLPEYIIRLPRYQLNEKKAYYSWNTPFDDVVPWTSSYPYGGWWRSEWIGKFFDQYDPSSPLTQEALFLMPTHMNRGNALELGGDGPTDRFADHIWPALKAFVPQDPKYDIVRSLLDGFQGYAFDDIAANNLNDDFVLANSWLYAMIEAIFVPVLTRTAPGFPLPEAPASPAVPILPTHPSRRFASIVILLANATQRHLLHYNWTLIDQVALPTLDSVLTRLGSRPWGIGARPNATMNGLAGAYSQPVRQLPDAQLPSINGAVELTACGASRFSSAIPLGESGLVTVGENGEPVFSTHSTDQFDLYRTYSEQDFPLLFNATQKCLTAASNKILRLVIIVSASVAGVVLLVLVVATLVWKFNFGTRYQQVIDHDV